MDTSSPAKKGASQPAAKPAAAAAATEAASSTPPAAISAVLQPASEPARPESKIDRKRKSPSDAAPAAAAAASSHVEAPPVSSERRYSLSAARAAQRGWQRAEPESPVSAASTSSLSWMEQIRAEQARIKGQPMRLRAVLDAAAQAELHSYSQGSKYPLAGVQSKARSECIRSKYAPPEVVDAMLFFQGLLDPAKDKSQRTVRFLRAGLHFNSWKPIVEEVRGRMAADIVASRQKWEARIEQMDADRRKLQKGYLQAYLEDLKLESIRLETRSAALKKQVKKFVPRNQETSRRQLLSAAVNNAASTSAYSGVADDVLIVRMFRFLRKPQYRYRLHAELEKTDFITPRDRGLGCRVNSQGDLEFGRRDPSDSDSDASSSDSELEDADDSDDESDDESDLDTRMKPKKKIVSRESSAQPATKLRKQGANKNEATHAHAKATARANANTKGATAKSKSAASTPVGSLNTTPLVIPAAAASAAVRDARVWRCSYRDCARAVAIAWSHQRCPNCGSERPAVASQTEDPFGGMTSGPPRGGFGPGDQRGGGSAPIAAQ